MNYQHRKPYQNVTEVFQIPVALFEVLSLIDECAIDHPDNTSVNSAKTLLQSIINTALNDPEAWLKIKQINTAVAKVDVNVFPKVQDVDKQPINTSVEHSNTTVEN